jgi:putative hydrolase of the HAD superfamily
MAAPAVVLFDLDDTVFAHRESVEMGIAAHRTAHGAALAAADRGAEFARWNALEERHYHRYLTGELDFLGQRRERAREFVAPYGLTLEDDAADAWYDAYLVHYRATWTLHDDVITCLEALRPARFGVITNGHLEVQAEKIDATGLRPWIDHIVASGEVGVAKPDAGIFLEACRVFEVAASDAVYIGDRLHTDAIGAARAGLRGVWLDRHGLATPAQVAEADAEGIPLIHSLDALPALLA